MRLPYSENMTAIGLDQLINIFCYKQKVGPADSAGHPLRNHGKVGQRYLELTAE